MTNNRAILSIINLYVQHKKNRPPLLSDLNLEVPEHKATALIGPNGCGKSTLVAVLAGLIPRFSGSLLFQGEPITLESRRQMGFVFDQPSLPFWMNACQILRFFQKLYVLKIEEEKLEESLEITGLKEVRKPFFQYSQGMRQRLAVAAALVKKPRLLILDEAFSSIDHNFKEKIINYLRSEIRNQRISVLFTTHNHKDCDLLADKVVECSPA